MGKKRPVKKTTKKTTKKQTRVDIPIQTWAPIGDCLNRGRRGQPRSSESW